MAFHTSPKACAGCHALINPPGFAFGHYDALGQWQPDEEGHPIDAASQMQLSGPPKMISFDGAVELAHAVADHPAPYRCLTQRLARYAYGRTFVAGDKEGLAQVRAAFEQGGWDIKELLVALAISPSFRLALPPADQE